jgi:hypothetical protein
MGYIRNKMVITDTDMLRDGETKYKIVLSNHPSEVEKYAAEELKFFFKRATDVELSTILDEEASYDVTAYYFVIGETTLLKELEKDSRYLNEKTCFYGDSVRLYSKGNMIFFSGSGCGPIDSVYEYLERVFGYKYYAKDEWTIEKHTLLKVPVFDIEYHPSIPRRALGFYDTGGRDYEYTHRLKLNNSLYSGWIAFAHTYFQILPKEKYFQKHPDWYSPDGKNLCLSNDEMKKEFVEQVKTMVLNSKEELFMLGQEDTFEFCSCPSCRQKIASYGGRASGVAMEFTNDVARQVGAWLKETAPERKLRFVAFAYNETYMPPAFYDECKGKYLPMSEKVKAEENVAVMIVPYIALYSSTYLNEEMNSQIKEGFLGWQAVSQELMVWSYCTIFENYMIPFNNLETVEENYRILQNIGTLFLFDQASHNSHVPCFEEMRQYVQAALMWGRNNVPKLIKEFCKAYYGEAAPCMEYVIQLYKTHAYYNEGVYQKYCGYSFDSFNELMDRKLWTIGFLDYLDEVFATARELVQKSPRKEILLSRVEKEYLTVQFFRLSLYPETFENYEEAKRNFDEIRKKHQIERLNEGGEGLLKLPDSYKSKVKNS